MKKLTLLLLTCAFCSAYSDPGIMIDIEIILDRPSGTGEPTLGALCK
jgi:hypothetical protein